MTFDEFRRRNLQPEDPTIYSTDSQAENSSLHHRAARDCAVEHPDKTEMNRYLEWLEEMLLTEDCGKGGA